MLKAIKERVVILTTIFFASILFVIDIFNHIGEWESYDIRAHIYSLALFYQSIKRDEIFVRWVEGLNNYGYPLGQIAHQVPAYLGAFINFITQSPLLSFKVVVFIAIFSSVLSFFLLLRKFFSEETSLLASLFFNFTAYRIYNIYVRAALPEVFFYTFLFLFLLGVFYIFEENYTKGFWVSALSLALMLLTHPFSIILSAPLILTFYLSFILTLKKRNRLTLFLSVVFLSVITGFLLSSYYLIPLKFEKKYFYAGLGKAELSNNQFLALNQIFSEKWGYSTKEGSSIRGDGINLGLSESFVFYLFSFYFIYAFIKKKNMRWINFFNLFFSLLSIFLMTKYSKFLYERIPFLAEIQFPWRFLGILGCFVVFQFAFLIETLILGKNKGKSNNLVFLILFSFAWIFFLIFRENQLYVKNSVYYNPSFYYFTKDNPHSVNLNPIWMSKGEDYPVKKEKIEIIEGEADILNKNTEKFNKHNYRIKVKSKAARFVDYTFYFPGWKVFVNGREIPLQFQDPNYRGVITFELPEGVHEVSVVYSFTKIRFLGILLSFVGLTMFVFGFLLLSKKFN